MKKGVFDLPVTLASEWIFNCYVVEGEGDSVSVIDPGLPCVAELVVQHLDASGRSVRDIAAVTCSHAHPDHMAGMPTLQSQGCDSFYLPELCESYLDGVAPRGFGHSHTIRFLPVLTEQPFSRQAAKELSKGADSIGFRGSKSFRFPLKPAGFVGSDSPLTSLPDWEVIATPGHTDEGVVFYHRDTETLITGDTVVTQDGVAWFNPEFVDAGDSQRSEEMLRSLPVRHLLPGHGRPIEGAVWANARSFREPPTDKSFLSRCARRIGNWNY